MLSTLDYEPIMPRPTIAVDCRMIAHSGIGTSLHGCLEALLPRCPDWKFILFGSPDSPRLRELVSANVRIRNFGAPIYSLSEQWGWLATSFGEQFDLLWIPHYNIPLAWPGRLLVTVHDIAHMALPSVFGHLKRAYASLFLHRVAKRADGVMFVSDFTANEFRRYFGSPCGISAVIHNGIGSQWTARRQRRTAGGGRPYIVAVGNVKPHKNLSGLVEAFRIIAGQVPHDLILIGKKDGFLTGDRTVQEAAGRLADRIRFTGWVSDEELIRLVEEADLLVHPSLYEGFGLPPLEAMALGCPVAVSRCSAMPDICGDAAAYFDPRSADSIASTILSTLLDAGRQRELSALGRARASRFSWQTSGRHLETLMRQVLARPALTILTRRQHTETLTFDDRRESASVPQR